MMRLVWIVFLLTIFPSVARADWVVGYEGDDIRGVGYLTRNHRLRSAPGREILWWTTASYLFYDVRDNAGSTRVTSPGLGTGVLYRWRAAKLDLGLGSGYEVRWTRRKSPSGASQDETEHGPVVIGDLHYSLNSLTRLTLQSSYSGASEWVAAGGRLFREISPTLRAGPEASWQGTDEVRVISYGGVAEVPFQERTALQLHAGQARIRYGNGNEETRPYYSVGIVRSFR
jgi:hypothetical protein